MIYLLFAGQSWEPIYIMLFLWSRLGLQTKSYKSPEKALKSSEQLHKKNGMELMVTINEIILESVNII